MDAAGRRPVHLGTPAGLHRHHRPARPRAARERRVRAGPRRVPRRARRLGDAAELLRRERRRHPRGRPPDRQGRARAGRAVLDAHRDVKPAAPAARLRTSRTWSSCAAADADEGRGPQGRPVARAQGVAALGRARRGRAAAARPRRRRRSTSAPDLVDRLRRRAAGRGVRRAARPRRRGRHRAGAARAGRRAVHRVRPVGLHPLHGQGRGQARAARRRAPDARLLRVQPGGVRGARAPRARCRRSRSGSTSRSWSSPPPRARRSASSSRAPPPTCPAAIVAAFSYDTKVLLERYVEGRDLAVSVLDGPDGPEALPVVEAIPNEDDFYDFEARYEIGRTTFVVPGRHRAGGDRARPGAGARRLRDARLLGLRARRPDARRRHAAS